MLNSSLVELDTLYDVVQSTKREGLNSYKELQFQTYLTPELSSLINDNNIAEVDEDYFDLVYYAKDQKDNGDLDVAAEFEHVSYRLNNSEYDKEFFAEIGTPEYILGKILEGTGFTVGTVEFTTTMTYSIQEKSSRRKMLSEFTALLGGELDFNKFTISILQHRGSTTPKNITEGRNFSIIGVSFNKRQKDASGNPLVAYTCKLIKPMEISLGDVVTMQYGTLGIDTSLRVVSITTNPYNNEDVEFEIGNFNPTLENDTYRIETTTVTKDKLYNGTRIGPTYGFESVLSNKKARSYFNSTGGAWQVGDGTGENWTDKLFIQIDPETGKAKLLFDGELSANVINAITANIQTIISTTIIVQNLYAQYGTIADLTTDSVDTSKEKVDKFLAGDKTDVYYQDLFNQHHRWITATYIGDLTNQTWTTYPASPELTADLPYQVVYDAGGSIRLICSADKWYYYYSGDNQLKSATAAKMYQYNGSAWVYVSTATNFSYTTILQSNYDVYTNDTLSSVMFTATTTATQYEQLVDRDLAPVYWTDGTHTGTTKEVTAYPVYIYKYTELVKLEISFKDIDGKQTPIITWGAGAGVEGHPDWGKAFDYKVADGIIRKYLRETDGQEVIFKIGENGLEGFGVGTIYHDRVATAKTINTVESVVLSKDILFPYMSKTEIKVTITGTVSAPCNITAKTYIAGNALNLQPVLPCNGNFTLSYSDLAQYITSGTKTIEIKLSTDTADGTVAIGQGIMTIQTFADTLPTLYAITGLTITPASSTVVDLGWTNPVSSYFTGVEVYRHTSDLSGQTREYCVANASLVYSSTGEAYSDTGLTAVTNYYYKIFCVYDIEGTTYYSSGVSGNVETLSAPPLLQSAATNTAGTIITLAFNKAMADPAGKHAQFSATVAGVARGITAATLNADTTKINLTLASAVTSGQVVTIDYTAGDVAAADGSPLASFSGQSVTNNAASAYQQWNGYPQTPVLTSTYPYQHISHNSVNGKYNLWITQSRVYKSGDYLWSPTGTFRLYESETGPWVYVAQLNNGAGYNLGKATDVIQANNDIYADNTFTTIYFAKTTP
jgi:uncharacterized repeat protein (TIGR02059 family)